MSQTQVQPRLPGQRRRFRCWLAFHKWVVCREVVPATNHDTVLVLSWCECRHCGRTAFLEVLTRRERTEGDGTCSRYGSDHFGVAKNTRAE